MLEMAAARPEVAQAPDLALGKVVDFRRVVGKQLFHLTHHVVRRKLQPGFRFTAIALHVGVSLAGDAQHGGVFAQRVDEQAVDTTVARMAHGITEQPSTVSPAARPVVDRDRKFRHAAQAMVGAGELAVGEVGDGDQLQPLVEDAQHIIVRKVQGCGVRTDALIIGRVAEPKVAVSLAESQQVLKNLRTVGVTEWPDRNPASPVRRLEMVGYSTHGLKFKG